MLPIRVSSSLPVLSTHVGSLSAVRRTANASTLPLTEAYKRDCFNFLIHLVN
jgi:hypothetical protein